MTTEHRIDSILTWFGETPLFGTAYFLYGPSPMASRYEAPFGPHGDSTIDKEIARTLLSEALSRGGDYADLFFEYSVSGSYGFDEGILKSAGRYVSMGLGVRVMKGDATGYAYVESLDMGAMKNAARTAAQIAAGNASAAPIELASPELPNRYEVALLSMDVEGIKKRELLERADKAARAADSRIIKVNASLSEEIREILIATSTGRFVRDRQPLIRFGVSAIAEADGDRQSRQLRRRRSGWTRIL